LNNRLAERMNRAMYTLSIVAAIFLPLGLLTGCWGSTWAASRGLKTRRRFSSSRCFWLFSQSFWLDGLEK
jgi:zinc transporter